MSSKRIVIWGIVALCLVGLYVMSRRSASKPKLTASGNFAPDFTVTDLDGRKFSLSDFKGKVVLLNFWATWCAPCRSEIPHFVEMQNQLGPQGFQVIGISMDDDAKPVREFHREYRLNYPVAMGDDKLAELYGGVLGLPVNFIIDRDGHIYSKHLGATDTSVFYNEINDLLTKH
jgi:peroxiredoxin